MTAPGTLIIPWQGRQLRARQDDPRLGPYAQAGTAIRSGVELASDVVRLRRR